MCSITHLSILDEYLLLYKKVSGRVSCAQTLAGGAGGTRTLDLCVANAPLSQLSYNPERRIVYHNNFGLSIVFRILNRIVMIFAVKKHIIQTEYK